MTAGAIALVVAGVWAQRGVREYLAQRHGPTPVPASVQQQSAGVTYSFSNQDGTTFTIRASHATQFKDGDHAELQDVWVTIYGKKGDRNDNIHTRECSYQPVAGNIQCSGEVDIDLQSAAATPGQPAAPPMHVTTSNIMFDRGSGEASTPAPVDITFAGGEGHGTGLDYSSAKALLRVRQGVAFQMAASERTGGLAVSAIASNLEFRRDDHVLALGGPVVMHQGDRQLAAQNVSIALDKQYHAQQVTATGNPVLSGSQTGTTFTVAADKFEGALDASGAMQQAIADGSVRGMRKSGEGEDHFSAAHVEFAMVPGRNLLQTMTATGGVTGDSHSGPNARTLETDALRLTFAVPPAGEKKEASKMDRQQIASAETLGPATIESKAAAETLNLKAARFAAQFGADGKLQRLLGHSGVEITQTPQNGTAQTSTAAELVASFGADGDWATVDETGNVRLMEDGKQATAASAQVVRDTDRITLTGSPVFTDGTSRTTAGSVTIDQKTSEIRATGGVVSTETASTTKGKSQGAGSGRQGLGVELGEGDAHISADTLSGSVNSGDVTFAGHARLWQGQAVLDADQIAVSRDKGQLDATGHVVAVFPQAPGQGPQLPSPGLGRSTAAKSGLSPQNGGLTVWQVHAEKLTFSNGQSMAHLLGGVLASSDQVSLQSQTLDIYLAPANSAPQAPTTGFAGRGLQRAVAQGNVIVSQNGTHGYSQQAEYDAARGKFTLSGGQPRLTDADGNTFSGHSLTFDVASDTISIVSDEGSRTLTRHRVEK
jgi:LPS export ABC transporter protein LptC